MHVHLEISADVKCTRGIFDPLQATSELPGFDINCSVH